MDSGKCAVDAFLEGLEPDPELMVSEWADQYRVLCKKTGLPYFLKKLSLR